MNLLYSVNRTLKIAIVLLLGSLSLSSIAKGNQWQKSELYRPEVHSTRQVKTEVTIDNHNPSPQARTTMLSTEITVGVGGDYASLSGTNGLFQAINTIGLSGNTRVSIVSSLVETGANALFGMGMGGYSLTIVPHDTTTIPKLIAMSAITRPMIRLYGVSRFTLNGQVAGMGRFLHLQSTNTRTTSVRPIIQINRGSSLIAIRNCILQSNTQTLTDTLGGMVNIGATGSNSQIAIQGNLFRGSPGSRYRLAIYSARGINNSGILIGGAIAQQGNLFQDLGISGVSSNYIQTAVSSCPGWDIDSLQ